jgi:tetratricopeptide (TPR) repeat protein
VPIHSPGYPYFLAAILALSGGSLEAVIVAQFVLGALAVYLVFRIAHRVFGVTTSLIAAAIAALYGTFLYFEGLVLATTLVLVLNLAFLDRLLSAGENPKPRALAVPGILLGLSIAVHPNALLVLAVFVAWLALRRPQRGRSPHARDAGDSGTPEGTASRRDRPGMAAALVLAGTAAIVILPIMVRNASLGGGPVLQRNVGKNFYIGMGPTADGTANIPPGARWERLKRQAWDAGARTASQETAYFAREALGYATRQPLSAIGLLLKKALFFVSGIHVDASQDFRFFRANSRVLSFPLPSAAVVLPLALLGVVRFRRRAPALVVYLASYLAISLAFAFATRYALPAHPVVILFAAAALDDLARQARARHVRSQDAVLLVVFLAVANVDFFGLKKRRLLHTTGHIAKIAVDSGQLDAGLRLYEEAAREHPTDPDIRNGWGAALDRAGRRDEARAQYEAALAADPAVFEARFNLAAQAHEARDHATAVQRYREAIEAAPWRADTRLNLGAVYADMDSLDRAAAEFQEALALAPDFREALVNLATVEMRRKNAAAAADAYKRLIAMGPRADLHVSLGLALTDAQDYLGAQEAFRTAVRLEPGNRAALFQLGMNLAGFQRFEEAISVWQRILDVDPTNEVALTAIAEARARIAARDSAAAVGGTVGGAQPGSPGGPGPGQNEGGAFTNAPPGSS